MSKMLHKFRGTLVGALVGDCLGSNYEGVSSTLPWGEVTDYTLERIKDEKEPIHYTDDTAMTRAICKSLTEEKKYDNRSMAKAFVQEFFKEPGRGYGAAVGTVFKRLRDTNPEDVTLPARSQFDGQGSYGNGAAMRISPVALYSRSSSEVQKNAQENALITHAHINGVNGAVLQAEAVFKALPLEPPNLNTYKFIDDLLEVAKKLEEEYKESSKEKEDGGHISTSSPQKKPFSYFKKLKEMKELLNKGETLEPETVVETFGNGIRAEEAVPAAIFSFLHKGRESFQESVNYAISLGGDTDTIASMAGAISGAYWGVNEIPELWKSKCEGVEEAIEFANKIFELKEERKDDE